MDLCFLPSLGFIANMPIIPSQRRLSGYRFFPPLEDEHEHELSRPRGAENEVMTFIDPSSGSILFAEAAPGFVPDLQLAQAVSPPPLTLLNFKLKTHPDSLRTRQLTPVSRAGPTRTIPPAVL
jgi:hypothetical protein